jgi:hypothetical protein
VTAIRNVKLLQNGTSEPDFIRIDPTTKNTLILTMPGSGEKAIVGGIVEELSME